MAQTVDQFAARAATLPGRLVEATPRAVRASGTVLEAAARSNVAAATGGDMMLSGVRRGKAARNSGRLPGQITINVRVDGAGRSATARVIPTGPIMLIEGDTKRHREPFQYGRGRRYAMAGERMANGFTARRRRAGRSGVIAFGGRVFSHVDHPGTRGKRPVRRAFQQSHDEAGRAGALVFATATRNHLGGHS